jgi:uncharacterized membrane protein YkvA (DUF1232 family)
VALDQGDHPVDEPGERWRVRERPAAVAELHGADAAQLAPHRDTVARRLGRRGRPTPSTSPCASAALPCNGGNNAAVHVARWLIIAVVVVAISWIVMIVLAKRLPPGLAKDLATVLPACVTTARRLRKDPRVPRRVKLAVAFAGLWVLSPIDLIPEFLPVIGPLDDIVVVALALRYAARHIPPEALVDAWPADRRILDRLAPATASITATNEAG